MPFWKKTQVPQKVDNDAMSPPVREAYERGRKDERDARHRHPVMMAGLVVLAAAGASLITLAAMTGSFGDGGQIADQKIAQAADSSEPVIDQAVSQTQKVAQEAGTAIKDKSRDVLGGGKTAK